MLCCINKTNKIRIYKCPSVAFISQAYSALITHEHSGEGKDHLNMGNCQSNQPLEARIMGGNSAWGKGTGL